MIRLFPQTIWFEMTTGMIDWGAPVQVPLSVAGAGAVAQAPDAAPLAPGLATAGLADPPLEPQAASAVTRTRASATRVVAGRRGCIGDRVPPAARTRCRWARQRSGGAGRA